MRDGIKFDGVRAGATKTEGRRRGADGGEVGQQLLLESRDDPKFAMILAREVTWPNCDFGE